jgi:hypothetical protein
MVGNVTVLNANWTVVGNSKGEVVREYMRGAKGCRTSRR